LADLVFEEEISIYLAAKELNIKYSTAKAIIKKFKAKGHALRKTVYNAHDNNGISITP
jgi:transposase